MLNTILNIKHKIISRLIRWISGGEILYSQLGEDAIIRHLTKYKKNGRYIDIGANNPRYLSNTYLFYLMGWKGLAIDPNSQKIALHKILRPRDMSVLGAVGPHKKVKYYAYTEDGLNTTDQATADKYAKQGLKPISVTETTTSPLHEFYQKYFKNNETIDFISLDTEGNDLDILNSNDWSICRPTYIILETLEYSATGVGNKLNKNLDTILQTKGYSVIAETNINTIYADTKANN